MYRRLMRPRPVGEGRPRHTAALAALLALGGLLLFLAAAALFLKDLSAEIAVSDASDVVTMKINAIIAALMEEGDYDGDYFVTFEKNDRGEVMAISSNMAHINALSAQILEEVVGQTRNHMLTVEIPVGNLTGVSLLMGRGASIPVEIIALTSSRVEFENSIVTAGINQTKHQIDLHVIMDIQVLLPWSTQQTQVDTEVLIADTIVVGQVPDTYVNFNE